MWGPLTTCAVCSKGWNELCSSALKELKVQYKRWVGKHITPYGIRTELWQVCTGAMGMQKRSTWPYPGLGLSELRLKDQLQPAEEEAEKGDFQTELEHPWQQISWPGSESVLVAQEHPEFGWPEPAFTGSVHHDDLTTELLGSGVNRSGPVPLHFLPLIVEHQETWTPSAVFL